MIKPEVQFSDKSEVSSIRIPFELAKLDEIRTDFTLLGKPMIQNTYIYVFETN